MIIITGTSSGIGKSLAEMYLSQDKEVIGISRRQTIEHSNYTHISCDLSNFEEVASLRLPNTFSEELIFIHNAGVLGNVKRFSDQESCDLTSVFQVNLIAGAQLIQTLLKNTPMNLSCKIAMISSGAAQRSIPSWSAYCSSKAALEIFLETVYLEELEKGRTNFAAYAISPGVVDTSMQVQIRQVDAFDFSESERFKELKATNQLVSSEEIAEKINHLFQLPYEHQRNYSLREIHI